MRDQCLQFAGAWGIEFPIRKINEPYVIGGVNIVAGNFVFGERDAVTNVEKVINTESKVRWSIVKEGVEAQEAYLKYGKF